MREKINFMTMASRTSFTFIKKIRGGCANPEGMELL